MSRLYLRDLPEFVGEEDLKKVLCHYGRVLEVKRFPNYSFVQFDSKKDAHDVLVTFQRERFLGKRITVEIAHPLRKDMVLEVSSRRRVSPSREPLKTRYPARYPVVVKNIPRHICWQELKDFGKKSGCQPVYCDLNRNKKGQGFIEFSSYESARRAVERLDGTELGGRAVSLSLSEHLQFIPKDHSRTHRTPLSLSLSSTSSYQKFSDSSTKCSKSLKVSPSSPTARLN
ncbi:hypothetical protein C8J56DRAFT_554798 [Mycena floridula]|nr:hypothetical protein C8J56DRAFT_554798 [Mycena floridula]